jgi:hypothetical protein
VANAILMLDDDTLRAQGQNRADLKKRARGYQAF